MVTQVDIIDYVFDVIRVVSPAASKATVLNLGKSVLLTRLQMAI